MADTKERNFSLALTALLFISAGAVVFIANGASAQSPLIPSDRLTVWNPGLNAIGGIPQRTMVCATVNASSYGHGAQDAGSGIQDALNNCPDGQVVMLSAGDFRIADRIEVRKGVTLRGHGPSKTKIRKPFGPNNGNVITLGIQWYNFIHSTNFATDGVKGTSSAVLANNPGLKVGEIVLVDQLYDPNITTWGSKCAMGSACRGWFSRTDRPTSQMMEIASITGNAITFSTAFHTNFRTSSAAQLSRISYSDGSN